MWINKKMWKSICDNYLILTENQNNLFSLYEKLIEQTRQREHTIFHMLKDTVVDLNNKLEGKNNVDK